MKIGVYSLTTNKFVKYYTVESCLQGTFFTHSFTDLSPTSNYAIAFITVFDGFTRDTVHGWVEII